MPQLRMIRTRTQVPQVNANIGTSSEVAQVAGAVAGILGSAGRMVEARREEQEEQEKSRAFEKLASAQLDWTQRQIDGQKAYDPATGKAYTPEVLKNFDSYRAEVIGKAGPGLERRILQERLTAMRSQIGAHAMEFEAGARSAYRRQGLTTTLGRRAAAAELDPAQAMDLMAQQMVEIGNSGDLSAVERATLLDTAKGQIAAAAAQSLATKNPQALREHPVFSMIPADRLTGILKLAEKSDQMIRSQRAADELMARGLPLDEVMRSIEKDYEGEDERAVKAEVISRFSYAEAARKDREQETYGTAQLEVEQRGRVAPETWAKLTDGHRAAILQRQQAEARQRAALARDKPVKTDFGLYLDLRQKAIDNPEEFAGLDLKQYVDKMAPTQLEQLIDLKGKNPRKPAAVRDAATLTQQMSATMNALGIKKAETKGAFQSFVQSAVDDAMHDNGGKALTYDQRQVIIDKALLQGPDPDAWLWGEKRNFELTPDQRTRFKPNAATDAPATEINALNDALKAQGIPQTPANRLALYTRANRKAQ